MGKDAAIWWIRRDLRLSDNPALQAALQYGQEVIPLFIADPILLQSPAMAPQRLAFLWKALRLLDKHLKQKGGHLILRTGKPADILKQVLNETGASKIFAQADFSPYAQKRDLPLEKILPIQWEGSPTLRHPVEVLKKDGTPYTVFTPYMRAWKEKPFPSRQAILKPPDKINTGIIYPGETVPAVHYHFDTQFPAGESEARERLAQFTQGNGPIKGAIYSYHLQRDNMCAEGTSRLSPYLKFGLLSARQVILAALDAAATAPHTEARKGAEIWLNELIWREFYTSILYHFPGVLQSSFRPTLQAIPWQDNEDPFSAWCEGRTGFPIVDAGMRELLASGWMHNRARMITASFLVKNLLINWQWGEKWFLQHLIDGDPAANNGGWQWTAGTGTDAAPYFRIFNPILQSKKFDPQGSYIRRWVPELRNVPEHNIHTPWKMTETTQHDTGCVIGKNYPPPIVDLKFSRERALQAYAFAKDQYRIQSSQ